MTTSTNQKFPCGGRQLFAVNARLDPPTYLLDLFMQSSPLRGWGPRTSCDNRLGLQEFVSSGVCIVSYGKRSTFGPVKSERAYWYTLPGFSDTYLGWFHLRLPGNFCGANH